MSAIKCCSSSLDPVVACAPYHQMLYEPAAAYTDFTHAFKSQTLTWQLSTPCTAPRKLYFRVIFPFKCHYSVGLCDLCWTQRSLTHRHTQLNNTRATLYARNYVVTKHCVQQNHHSHVICIINTAARHMTCWMTGCYMLHDYLRYQRSDWQLELVLGVWGSS